MCTPIESYNEAVKAVEDTLFKPDVNGHTRFAREVHSAVFDENGDHESRFQRELKKAFYNTFGKWFFTGGAIMLAGLVVLYLQVQSNTESIQEGGRYTQEDASQDSRLQENRDNRQDEDIRNLREENNDKFDAIDRKLDQLINRLIP